MGRNPSRQEPDSLLMQFVPRLILSRCFITLDKLRPGWRGGKTFIFAIRIPQLHGTARAFEMPEPPLPPIIDVWEGMSREDWANETRPQLQNISDFCAQPPGGASLGEKQGWRLGFGEIRPLFRSRSCSRESQRGRIPKDDPSPRQELVIFPLFPSWSQIKNRIFYNRYKRYQTVAGISVPASLLHPWDGPNPTNVEFLGNNPCFFLHFHPQSLCGRASHGNCAFHVSPTLFSPMLISHLCPFPPRAFFLFFIWVEGC